MPPEPETAPTPAPPIAPPSPPREPSLTPIGPMPFADKQAEGPRAVELLALLQREGRLLDFVEEDLGGASDWAIGQAAREVHAGCRRAVARVFALEPVLPGGEGTEVTVERALVPGLVTLRGAAPGEAPVRGRLRHHGWRVRDVLPAPRLADPRVVQPAEVEAAGPAAEAGEPASPA
ncbi:MAG: DUF2760 domain-containing protein [Anaeromyxobacteraceae bacterium]